MGLPKSIRKFLRRSEEKPFTAAPHLISHAETAALASASAPDIVSSVTRTIAPPAPDQVVPSIAQLANSSPPSVPAQPTTSDTPFDPPTNDLDPWTRAYKILEDRQPELLADYKKHLQGDAAAGTDISTPQSVKSVVEQLLKDREKKQWHASILGKDIKTRPQVERLVKLFAWSEPIIKNALSAQPYAALAWSGVSVLLPLLTSSFAQNEAMLKGFNLISDEQVYWIKGEEKYLHQQNYQDLVEPLANLYSHVIEYQARVICHLSSPQLERAWDNLTHGNSWVSLAGKVNDLSKKCSDCLSKELQEELRKNSDSQLQEIQGSRKTLDEILLFIKDLRAQTQINDDDKKETDLLRDLVSDSDYEGYKDFNPKRVPGTCEWFFGSDEFRRWRDSGTSSLLWVSAGPGCGKSVLSRALIDEGLLSTNITTSTVCHFFFKDGEIGRMDSTNALCAILHQLFTHDSTGSLIKHALKSHREHGKELRQKFSKLWQILENCATSSDIGEIICILDALDECSADSREKLIDELKKFYEGDRPSSKLKFLITSRPYDVLEGSFKKFSATTAYVRFDGDNKTHQISQEINLVIDARMDDIAGNIRKEDRDKISERLKGMGHRTYLWLHLTIEIIKQSPSKYGRLDDLEELLSKLPAKVSDAYEKILGRITVDDEKRTETLLQIILAAEQPLTLDEANIALTLALHNEQITSHKTLQSKLWHENFQSIVKNLSGLFISVYNSKLFFIHQTAREFLLHSERQGEWKGRFNMPESHATISRPCIYYLLMPDIVAPIEENFPSRYTYDPQFHFLPYAAAHWPLHYGSQHFHDTGMGSEKEISELALRLCETGSQQAWSIIYNSKIFRFPISASSLTIASYLGFKAVVERLLATGKVELNSKGGRFGRTPLSWAAERGHEAVVQLLLTTGKVDLESKDQHGRTPLSWAAERGHEAVVQLLLETGKVETDSKDNCGQTPLSWAAGKGQEAVVRLLLETGKVETDSKDNRGRTPLSSAASEGHEAVVQLLLETGKVEPDSKDEDGWTPLLFAAYSGSEAVVRLLLATGRVEPDSKDNECGQTPLSWAAEEGQEAVVRLLLETGKVEPETKNKYGWTPLLLAAGYGHEAVVRLLLATGKVDIESKDQHGRTPLSWAAGDGYEAVVRLLLATGKVDLESKDQHGRTPLSWAAWDGHEDVVQLLLATGKIKLNSKDKDGWTPIFYAAMGEHEAVVQLLLATGKVELDSKDEDNYGQTPLSWPAGKGHEAVVRLVLKTGKVELDSEDEEGRTPLSWAAGKGRETVVRLLLETGNVELDSKDEDGWTPLLFAAHWGSEAVVRLLLATGRVEPEVKDTISGRTALSWAAGEGHEAVVQLLLATGRVDPNTNDNEGRTPIFYGETKGNEAVVQLLLAAGKAKLEPDAQLISSPPSVE